MLWIDKEGGESTTPIMVAEFNDNSLLANLKKVNSNHESTCHTRSLVLSHDSDNDYALDSPNIGDGSISIASFSGFSDPGGRFASTNNSFHYCLGSGVCLSDGYSCHGCVETIFFQGSYAKFDSSLIGSIPSWVHVFSMT